MLEIICGLPGHGKTNIATERAIKEYLKGRPIYSSFPIKVSFRVARKKFTLTTYQLTRDMVKDKTFPENAYLIIDECQNWFNSRKWKDMTDDDLKFFTGHRHAGVDMLLTVQHPARIDVALREIADKFVLVEDYILFRRLTEYYSFDDIGRRDVDKRFYKVKIKLKKKYVNLSYRTRYLKDTFDLRELCPSEPYPIFEVENLTLFKKLYRAYKLKYEFHNRVLLEYGIKRRFDLGKYIVRYLSFLGEKHETTIV